MPLLSAIRVVGALERFHGWLWLPMAPHDVACAELRHTFSWLSGTPLGRLVVPLGA